MIQAYSDDTRERYIAARIGENGPVLATQKVSGIGIYSSNSTYVAEVEQYEDGTRLYEMLVVKNPNRKDVELKLRIFVAGVLFDDGTVEKSLTAADFDEIGCAKVYFIYPPETKTSICHNLSAYQDGEYMGLRR